MTSKTATAAALLLAASATHATAQDAPDYYVTGALGASIAEDWDTVISSGASAAAGEFETSPLIRFGVGHNYDGPLRAEVELAYRALDFADAFGSTVIFAARADVDGRSDVEATTLMVTGLYDIDLPTSGFGVYIGAGLGVAQVDVDLTRGPDRPNFVVLEGDYTALAGQLRLGVDHALQNGMTIFADYTYLHVADGDYDGFNSFSGNVTQTFGAINTQELAIGLRYNF